LSLCDGFEYGPKSGFYLSQAGRLWGYVWVD